MAAGIYCQFARLTREWEWECDFSRVPTHGSPQDTPHSLPLLPPRGLAAVRDTKPIPCALLASVKCVLCHPLHTFQHFCEPIPCALLLPFGPASGAPSQPACPTMRARSVHFPQDCRPRSPDREPKYKPIPCASGGPKNDVDLITTVNSRHHIYMYACTHA